MVGRRSRHPCPRMVVGTASVWRCPMKLAAYHSRYGGEAARWRIAGEVLVVM
jgi:hypothetical protein